MSRDLETLLRDRGPLPAREACSLLLKIESVSSVIARNLLRGLVEGDTRFVLGEDETLRLAAPRSLPGLPFRQLRFTVIDLETTGGSPSGDRILEIGAVRVEEGSLGESFGTLIDPGVPIPPFIVSMTGIRPGMVESAPRFSRVAEEVAAFLGDSVVVAHNLPFDWGFLNEEMARSCGFVLTNPSLCTVRLGRKLLPQLPDRTLDTLADFYGFRFEARHRAVDDARVTARLLLKFLALLEEKGIRDLPGIERFLAGQDGEDGMRLSGTERRPRRSPSSPSSAGS